MKKKYQPALSVVMPVYNAENYLHESISSILRQTFRDFEFIIIDDGSKDRSWQILKKYAAKDKRIVLHKNNTNLKISKTLNTGLELAKGKYIIRMDADDSCLPQRFQIQYDYMEKHPEVVISGTAMEVCDSQLNLLGIRSYQINDTDIRKKLFKYSPFCHASTISVANVIKEVKYNEYLYDSEDYDMYFRIGMYGKFGNLPNALYKMRINNSGVSLKYSRRQEILVLYIRIKAVIEYKYKFTSLDVTYFLIQLISFFIIPSKVKFFVFNLLRNRWKKEIEVENYNLVPQIPFWGPISYFRVFLLKSLKRR